MTCPNCHKDCKEARYIRCDDCNHLVGIGPIPLPSPWTDQPPAQPGWYFYRHRPNAWPIVGYYEPDESGLWLKMQGSVDGTPFYYDITDLKGQWSGPLNPPH